MILNLYSIKDKLSDFKGVLTILNDPNAERIFEGYCRKQKAENFTSCKYFELYKVGTYNTESGEVKGYPLTEIKLIAEGEQYDE